MRRTLPSTSNVDVETIHKTAGLVHGWLTVCDSINIGCCNALRVLVIVFLMNTYANLHLRTCGIALASIGRTAIASMGRATIASTDHVAEPALWVCAGMLMDIRMPGNRMREQVHCQRWQSQLHPGAEGFRIQRVFIRRLPTHGVARIGSIWWHRSPTTARHRCPGRATRVAAIQAPAA